MKNRLDEKIISEYQALLKRLQGSGVTTKKHYNKCSTKLKELIQDTSKLELVSPNYHRCNVAEISSKAFEQYILGILVGLTDNFPWLLWDILLPQTKIILNLLPESNATPTVSAYTHMYGNFDYNRISLAPMSCPCHIHVKLNDRTAWNCHAQKGYYLFTPGNHHYTHNMFTKDTETKRLSDTVDFLHRKITCPIIGHVDLVKTINNMKWSNITRAKKME